MKMLAIVVIIISCFEIKAMMKKGLKKEIFMFAVIGLIAVVYGYYYLTHQESASLVGSILDLFGLGF